MKRNWLIVLITAALLLALLLPITLAQPEVKTSELFHLEVKTEANTEKISCWKSEKGEFYLFLPAYTELSTAVFNLHTESEILIDGKKIVNGQNLENFQLNKKYTLTFEDFGKKQTADFIIMQSQNIATMYIDTQSGSMEYIHNNKGKGEEGTLRTYNADGKLNCKVSIESLSGRGNNTWDMLDKKPYSLDLTASTDILGMGGSKRWVLLANAADPSNLRNKIAYDFAKAVKLAYSPDAKWVDLYLNGEYAGLYLLSERNEVLENRVDISGENGVLLSWENEAQLIEKNKAYVTLKSGKTYRIHYPKNVGNKKKEEILNKCQALEDALLSNNQEDLFNLIDLESWARKYLIDEMLGNLDGYLISHYLYYDGSDGKIYCGPIWDYDKTMGNSYDKGWQITNPNLFVVDRYKSFVFDNGYIEKFLQNEEFSAKIKQLFKDEFSTKLNDFLHVNIRDYIKEINLSFEMNKIRWYNNADIKDLETEADKILNYLTAHNEYLNKMWVEGQQYVKLSITKLPCDMFYNLPVGGTLSEMPIIEDCELGAFAGLYYVDSNEPFDITKPITEDTDLYAKWNEYGSGGVKDLLKLAPFGLLGLVLLVMLFITFKEIRKSR